MTPLSALEQAPLPLLLALPAGLAATAQALADGTPSVLAVALSVTAALSGVLLVKELRRAGSGQVRCARELVALDREVSADRLLVAVLEQRAASTTTGGSTDRTRALLAELVRTEEATRAFIGAELHDTVAQTLSQALQELRAGRSGLGIDSVREAEHQLRGVLSRLQPPELADGDLAQAVRDLCRDLERRYAVGVDVRWPSASVELPGPVGTTVYRFVQEALLNAAVHADGVDVRLDVQVDAAGLSAAVSDGGAGFEPERVQTVAGRHVGLSLVRERARLAGGDLDVRSAPGRGTTVRLSLPLG